MVDLTGNVLRSWCSLAGHLFTDLGSRWRCQMIVSVQQGSSASWPRGKDVAAACSWELYWASWERGAENFLDHAVQQVEGTSARQGTDDDPSTRGTPRRAPAMSEYDANRGAGLVTARVLT